MYIYIYKHIYVYTLTLKNFCQARFIDAARRNMHGIVDLEGHNLGHGLYPMASFFNHRFLLRVYQALSRVNRVLSRVYMSIVRVYMSLLRVYQALSRSNRDSFGCVCVFGVVEVHSNYRSLLRAYVALLRVNWVLLRVHMCLWRFRGVPHGFFFQPQVFFACI